MFGRFLVKGTMLIVNIVFAVLLLVTLSASYINPEQFVIPAFTTLIFPLTVAANMFFVVFWLLAKKWHFLLSLLLLLLSSNQIAVVFPVHFGRTHELPEGQKLRVLSYNTMLFGHLKKHTESNPNKTIEHILTSDADVVCLQEFAVSSKSKGDYLTHSDIYKIFKKYPYKHIEYNQNENWKRSGIATFSKFPIVNKIDFSESDEFGVTIYSDIKVGDDTIRLFNNHLESNRLTERDRSLPLDLKDDFDSDKLKGTTKILSRKLFIAYKTRAKQAKRIAKEIEKSPYKVLLCGDFNDVPASFTYSQIKGDLKDAYVETGLGLGWTLNLSIYRFRIDYIFYDSRYFQTNDLVIDKVKCSDHFPIHADIILKN